MIFLQTERLIPRNYTMDDVPEVHEYFSDEKAARYEDSWPKSAPEVEEMLSERKDLHVKEVLGDCDDRNAAQAKLPERPGFEPVRVDDRGYKEDPDGNPIAIRARVYKLTVKGRGRAYALALFAAKGLILKNRVLTLYFFLL